MFTRTLKRRRMLRGSTTAVSQASSDKSWLQVCWHMSRVFSGMEGETSRVLRTVSCKRSQHAISHKGQANQKVPVRGRMCQGY